MDKLLLDLPKPVLKWVGGKTQIIEKLAVKFPKEINNYHEIFLGGASVLFCMLHLVKKGFIKLKGKVYAYDLNEPLISLYKNIQEFPDQLYDIVQDFISEYNSCGDDDEPNRNPSDFEEAKHSKESYYYWVRRRYNNLSTKGKKTLLGSAMFIFLNKTCFRGVFRVGPNGFNVPYGHYKNPEIINKEHLEQISDLIKNVNFECCDFTESLKKVEQEDFLYLDPPYAPETSKSFVKYTENGFALDMHNSLFSIVKKLDKSVKILMSNADVSLVKDNFKEYNIDTILCRRSINSKNPEAKTNEVIIKNY